MTPLAIFLVLAQTSLAAPGEARALHERLRDQVAAAYDSARGGFVSKAGLPSESAVELALIEARDGNRAWAEDARATLEWTRGLMDTLAGGYYHGGNERESGEETLSKRADSNARRLENLVRAWDLTSDPAYRVEAARVVDFMERVLLDGRGGFVSAQVGDRDLDPAMNGLAIQAWLSWSAATLDPARRDFALRSLDRVWETSWHPLLGLVVRSTFGDVLSEPGLMGQVEMGRACILAHRLCGRTKDRDRARQLGDLILARFAERTGGFHSFSMPQKNGSIRKAPKHSHENARAARFLYELSALVGDDLYRQGANRAWAPFQKGFGKLRLEAADWALAARASFAPETPAAPEWASAEEPAKPPRRRSTSFKLGR